MPLFIRVEVQLVFNASILVLNGVLGAGFLHDQVWRGHVPWVTSVLNLMWFVLVVQAFGIVGEGI